MMVTFFDLENKSNPRHGKVAYNENDLSTILDAHRMERPFVAQLVGENGYELTIGIGGPVGCVQYARSDGDPPCLIALSDQPQPRQRHVEFMLGGTLTPIRAKNILPYEKVKEIAIYFQQSGRPSPAVSWDDV